MIQKIHRNIPEPVLHILKLSEGWLVGAAIQDLLNQNIPRDYDIIINPKLWSKTFTLISNLSDSSYRLNSHGGIKLTVQTNIEIDIWMQNLEDYLTSRAKYQYLYNFAHNILLSETTIIV